MSMRYKPGWTLEKKNEPLLPVSTEGSVALSQAPSRLVSIKTRKPDTPGSPRSCFLSASRSLKMTP